MSNRVQKLLSGKSLSVSEEDDVRQAALILTWKEAIWHLDVILFQVGHIGSEDEEFQQILHPHQEYFSSQRSVMYNKLYCNS